MTHAYTEDQLVEQPAIRLFATLGWQTVSAMEETLGAGGTLGRETKRRGGAGRAPARGAVPG
jgi:type I restriction enzyme R subunit